MATPQSGRFAITPTTPNNPSRVLSLKSPLSDETIWKRLREAGFDEESIKRRDKGSLIAHIAKLEAEIFNAVAVVGYLNATLVITNFRFHSIWRDPSKFSDIYDEELFVKTLENGVRIVDTVLGYLMERFGHNLTNVFNFKTKGWAPVQYYMDTVLPRLLEEN
ncbi:hypothetical protein L2E82_27133 [Cichorium intybus]|uniref:Uncharacterized protein n=1 Tax=Cichorium intybus TaxID=13427 RepID=A0ACB9CS22_CICIN|nr:hypothetical protein L2E82_27133 [Cichorium intybus]